MKLQEIFEQLAYGELSQIRIGQNDEGEVDETGYPTLVAHINLGLSALYRRFNLKERRLTFVVQEGVDTYKLDIDDINKVEQVINDKAWSFSINDEGDPYSVFTPTLKTLVIPVAITGNSMDVPDNLKSDSLTVIYRASHPILRVEAGYIDPFETEVELPYSHLEALLYFIASRVHNPIGMVNEFHAGSSWAAKYEQECQRLQVQNIHVDSVHQGDRLHRNGWL